MATINGFFVKTNKLQEMNYLIKDDDNACALLRGPNDYALIQDGNSSFYVKDVPPTIKTISQRILGSLPAAAERMFSTHSYINRLHSPKLAERDRRGCDEKFIVEGLHDENKKSFIHHLLEHWSSTSMMEEIFQRPIIFIEGVKRSG